MANIPFDRSRGPKRPKIQLLIIVILFFRLIAHLMFDLADDPSKRDNVIAVALFAAPMSVKSNF